MGKSQKVAIRTLGCKLNQYESMGIAETLQNAGYKIVPFRSVADVYIINTCTVTGKTDRRSRNAVHRVRKLNPEANIIVTGCGVQRDPDEFAHLPNVKILAGNREKFNILELIEKVSQPGQLRVVSSLKNVPFESIPITTFGKYTRAFIKIQDGCNQKCSYCIVPTVRGPSRSQYLEAVISEVKNLVKSGFKEIVLTGIHLGLYGLDLEPATNLPQLLRKLVAVSSLERIRLSSIEPTQIMPKLVELMIHEPKICRHLHIPLQSGCDDILKRMNRSYGKEEFKNLISGVKEYDPDFCIGTDVIVAFPGETDRQFEQTYEFIKDAPFNYLHVFTFSPRDGTPAANFSGRIDPVVAKKRCHALRDLSRSKMILFRRKFIGRQLPIIILGSKDKKSGLRMGLSDNYINVLLQGSVPSAGSIASVKVTEIDGIICYGTLS